MLGKAQSLAVMCLQPLFCTMSLSEPNCRCNAAPAAEHKLAQVIHHNTPKHNLALTQPSLPKHKITQVRSRALAGVPVCS